MTAYCHEARKLWLAGQKQETAGGATGRMPPKHLAEAFGRKAAGGTMLANKAEGR